MKNAFAEKRLGRSDLKLKNVFIRSAAYEGMLDQGLPNQDLTDHHVAMARGNVALTTVSYGAVSADARTFNTQMYINDESLERLKVLAAEVHKAGGKVSMQLTHCGYFSKNKDSRHPLAPSRVFNEYGRSIENRSRFPLEVIRAVIEKVGLKGRNRRDPECRF